MYNHEPDAYECPICVVARGKETEYNKRSDIVFEDDDVIAFISPKWWKNNPGNVIVVPRKHIENIYDIDEETLSKVQIVGRKMAIAIRSTYACDGVSFRQHNEPDGGQDVWHFHLHVFPRWKGDELYLNHNEKRMTLPIERQPYAEKLRKYLEQ